MAGAYQAVGSSREGECQTSAAVHMKSSVCQPCCCVCCLSDASDSILTAPPGRAANIKRRYQFGEQGCHDLTSPMRNP
eukprot:2479142-Amphidinium_carterae.1